MPYDGSGTYTPAAAPSFPAVGGAVISSTYYNAVINDLCTNGLSNALTRDGQGKPTAAIDWNGQNLTNINNLGAVTAAFSGAVTMASTLAVTGALTVGGTAAVTGNTTVGGTLAVTGATTLGTATITTATLTNPLAIASGGLALATVPTNGQVLIGNGTGYTLATITAGSGIAVTNGAGSISISATGGGGTVTSVAVSGGTTGLTTSGGPITGSGTITLGGALAVANGGTGSTTAGNARTALGAAASGANTDITSLASLSTPLSIAQGGTASTTASAARTALGLGTVATFDETTATQFRNNTVGKALSTDKVWSAADLVALTDAATIAVDLGTFLNGTVTLGGNRTLGNPTNTKVGQSGVNAISQDGTGSRTLAYAGNWKFHNGVAPTLTTTAGAMDLLYYQVFSSTFIFATVIGDVK